VNQETGETLGARSFEQGHLASCSSNEARDLVEKQHAIEFGALPLRVFRDSLGRRTVSFVVDKEKCETSTREKLRYLTESEVELELSGDHNLYKSLVLAYLKDNSSSKSDTLEELLSIAWALDASDFHFMPGPEGIEFKLRVNGEMISSLYFAPEFTLQNAEYQEMLRRLKNLCSLDHTEHNLPQEGACSISSSLFNVRLRVSIIPGKFGPYLSARLIGIGEFSSSDSLVFSNLGFDKIQSESVRQQIEKRNGVVLFTGPTGSGKSTALQACLKHLSGEHQRIVSVEDPIERELAGVTQIEVDLSRMRSYRDYLPVILRQDPDIIGIGEIRDQDSARFVFEAGSTGHLILSGMHADSVVSALMRLMDFQISPSRLQGSLNLVVNQRLVLANCQHCLERQEPSKDIQKFFGLSKGHYCYRSNGCQSCSWSGHGGRVPVYDLVDGAKVRAIVRSVAEGKDQTSLSSRPLAIYRALKKLICTGAIAPEEALKTLGFDSG